MKLGSRIICTLLCLSLLLGLCGCGKSGLDSLPVPESASGDNGAFHDVTHRKIQNRQDALAAIQEASFATGIANVSESLGQCREYNLMGTHFYRFTQSYQGIPVYGRTVTVGADAEGEGRGLSHNCITLEGLDIKPKISEEKSRKTLAGYYGEDAGILSQGLTIYSLYGHTPTLAWQFLVMGPGLQDTCFVDAKKGTVIGAFSHVLYETVEGSCTDGTTTHTFLTEHGENGGYILRDGQRNIELYDAAYQTAVIAFVDDRGNVYTLDPKRDILLDANGNVVTPTDDAFLYGKWDIYNEKGEIVGRNADILPCTGQPLAPLKIVHSDSTTWSDQAAVEAMVMAENAYDFWQEILGRKGFNGDNGLVRITVRDDLDGKPTNAFSSWGSTRAFTFLNIGHQNAITADLVGHEYAHSVEASISGMAYFGESGAVMEALSDIFGELLEDWVEDKMLDDDCDWVHGNRSLENPAAFSEMDCFYEYNGMECPVKAKNKNGRHIQGDGLQEPGWFSSGSCYISIPYPAEYQGANYYYGTLDNGGVHTNCTVISHAAYRMTHPEDTSLEALTNEELARVLYTAIGYLTVDCSFSDFASWVCYAAETLGLSDGKQHCIATAFIRAGVEVKDILVVPVTETRLDHMISENSEWNVYGASGSLCDDYTLHISGKEPLENLYHTGPLGDTDDTVEEYKVTAGAPLTLKLEPGYMYNFLFTDGKDPDKIHFCTVGVYSDSLGLISIVDVHTDFGSAFSLRETGLLMLTERPGADRSAYFTYREYPLQGYVYQTNRGGYTIHTYYPDQLGEIASFRGDFSHCGEQTLFRVVKEWNPNVAETYIWLKISGVVNGGVSDLSLYTDTEAYYYIIDCPDAAYLVCEKISYDNFEVKDGGFDYCQGSALGGQITESITVINMANYDRHTLSVRYYTNDQRAIFEELTESLRGERESNSLFYIGYSNQGQLDSYGQTVAYFREKLADYGLGDRVFSDYSALSGYTPVFSAATSGTPTSGTAGDPNTDTVEGTAKIGFPKYDGNWFPSGVVREPSEAGSGSDPYENFLKNRGYLPDWNAMYMGDYFALESYSRIDIDQDGTDELIVLGSGELGFCGFLVYRLDSALNGFVLLSVGRSQYENDIRSCYGGLSYWAEHRALVFSETRNSAAYGSQEYFVLTEAGLEAVGSIWYEMIYPSTQTSYYEALSGPAKKITKDQWDARVAQWTALEFQPLP